MRVAVEMFLTFERSLVFFAASFAWAKTGKRMAARIAMMAITTRSSMSVNARLVLDFIGIISRDLRTTEFGWNDPRERVVEDAAEAVQDDEIGTGDSGCRERKPLTPTHL